MQKTKQAILLTAILYSLFLLSLVYFAIPIERFLRGNGLYGIFFYGLVGIFCGTVGTFLWFRRRRLNLVRIFCIAAILAVYGLLYLSTPYYAEKIHLGTYSFLALLYRAGFQKPEPGLRADLIVIFLASLLGLLDEYLQGLVPGRFFQWKDLFFNSTAASLALGLKTLLGEEA